jgi:hypothetical protein
VFHFLYLLVLGVVAPLTAHAQVARDFLDGLGFPEDGEQARLLLEASDYWFRSEQTGVPLRELGGVDAILAFSFGQTPGGEPGPTNRGLAAVCARLRRLTRGRVPILAQWEIDDELTALGEPPAAYRAVVRDDYLSTLGVLAQFAEYSEASGRRLERVALVAQEDHAFRARKLLENVGMTVLLGAETTRPPGGWAKYLCDQWGYHPGSAQEWTRSRSRFLLSDMSTLLRALADGHLRAP